MNRAKRTLDELLKEIRACQHCAENLPLGPRPILAASTQSKILIVGQAPGTKVHRSGIAWDDASGERLRDWMGITNEDFYDTRKIAIVPMGFCYPGKGKSGDLPPRPECAELWHEKVLRQLNSVQLKILVGQYAQRYILGNTFEGTLTATVKNWKKYQPTVLPLPHPSPRNNIWLRKNPWFESSVLPWLKKHVQNLINA